MKTKTEAGYITPIQLRLFQYARILIIIFGVFLLAFAIGFSVINTTYTFSQQLPLYGSIAILIYSVTEFAVIAICAVIAFWLYRFFRLALNGRKEKLSKGFAYFNIILSVILSVVLCLPVILLGNDSVGIALKATALTGISGLILVIVTLILFIRSLTVKE